MKDLKLDDVQLVLANPQSQLRNSLRMAMNDAGIRNANIVDGNEIGIVHTALQGSFGPDILICDLGSRSPDDLKILSAIRHNEIGPNPFLGIIAISWDSSWKAVDGVMGTGVDFLIAAPVSPQQILDRISSLVHHRKPFIVTTDYVGPDRREGRNREPSGPLIDVPNTLRAKALGEWKPSEMRSQIAAALTTLNDQKMARHAYQLAYNAELIAMEHLKRPDETDRQRLKELLVSALDLKKRAAHGGLHHVAELAGAVQTVVDKLRDPSSATRSKDVELLQQLAFAIRAAVNPLDGEEDLALDIAQTVNASRAR